MWTYSRVGEGSEKPDRFDVGRLILMYGVAGDDAVGRRQLGRFFPINFVDPTYSGLLLAECMTVMTVYKPSELWTLGRV